ncbi:hypothetical protein CPC08DRAFT_823890 [Agrocybe pediades]|nr:hypothetical protein CPC08DRAFT_823890 [Agrocybe pediades]
MTPTTKKGWDTAWSQRGMNSIEREAQTNGSPAGSILRQDTADDRGRFQRRCSKYPRSPQSWLLGILHSQNPKIKVSKVSSDKPRNSPGWRWFRAAGGTDWESETAADDSPSNTPRQNAFVHMRLLDSDRDTHHSLARLRSELTTEILAWLKSQMRLLPQLQETLHDSDSTLHAESLPLFLPSDFSATERRKLQIGDATAMEYKLREGQANEAVEGICHSILHHVVVLDTKNEHAWGVAQNTRPRLH